MTKLWGGRFTKEAEAWVDEFGASIGFDQKLVTQDIRGSMAHVAMLRSCNIISEEEGEKLHEGLAALEKKASNGELSFDVKYEDIHMNIEKLLTDEIGEIAGKLHTARSRNDQVATDMHLFMREETETIIAMIRDFQHVLVSQAEEHTETMIPGYTHLQRAQPISMGHHLLAYVAMLDRDADRLQDSLKRVNISPLGAGALAGTTFPIDRWQTAETLGFDAIYENSLDAVSDRDYLLEFLSVASTIMMHLSRLSEEIILWSSEEFSFIELDDAFATGSSIMPQKKNPDMGELVRGKTGRVYGSLVSLLTTLKSLPLAYNKDMQEDKEGVFDSVITVKGSLKIFTGMIDSMVVHEETTAKAVSSDFSNATELADYLAAKGMPFREAHEVVGKLVLHCIENDIVLAECPFSVFREASELFEEDIYETLAPYQVVSRRNSEGGTGFKQVREAIRKWKERLAISE
ncbi:argininosuccinate lyase [Salicibibacter halophilus]|uniref:Argininosuccinate lyase n=1 Tax=Salicibibacter halophilus TaxID=2502791 RepID=A0A514LH54_9BACI|nr:argininosuccinate lyase [Salicibibacter halophilus]QDI91170.1 argininosuccinate lyase [Salicibibacter halophilus]